MSSINKEEKRITRHICLQLLYASEVSENFTFSESLSNFSDGDKPIFSTISKDQLEYIKKLFQVSVDYKKKVEDIIKLQLDNWDISRLALIDKIILRMAISEMLFIDEVPPKVSITEGVEIAKEFSTKDSSRFVNGILDAVYNKVYQTKEKIILDIKEEPKKKTMKKKIIKKK